MTAALMSKSSPDDDGPGTFTRVGPPWWDEKPCAIVGNGPSLRGLDLGRLRSDFHVLAVKGAMFNVSWADAGFGLDLPRYREWQGIIGTLTYPVYWATPKLKFLSDCTHPRNVRLIRRVDIPALSDDPTAICSGGSSGFGAVNLAWLKRSRRMLLLGFDYNADAGGHHDLRAYVSLQSQDEMRWRQWAKNFNRLQREIDLNGGAVIINAAPESRITAFPRMDIEAALAEIRQQHEESYHLHGV
jgi:hypothetical protein